ncbi:phage tail protein I [Sphingomonas sanguinis]|jgi:phage tail P2-like protein|uniref:Phage tail protein I n=1 Tax=Sphingomonas sanguinis TaxID=33051 RepID=A0A7Y7UPM5_9SPHN|nr:phage tail protein I [Sphingomonas sanguinis]MBZ6381120.1 phage tail protein I [Sphingomonas sanguinis]NNG51276.1 phage tail protein I [Sphingomonas sanguinis]NNG55226.1 phage tail protein I [Sphingomonas sanguinis]NVP30422.1 phage tail protein I [Sphingomonas sanguinis]
MSDLLPPNATSGERALADVAGRVGDVGAPIRDVWNPDTCPPALLAWLAWAFSVDQWDDGWTEAQKRRFIKQSVEIHRHKGTIGAVQDALAALGIEARVQEWFNQTPPGAPYTFRVLLEVDQIGVPQGAVQSLVSVVERTKNLRSHLIEASLSVRSVAGTHVAIAAGVGSEITVAGFEWATSVINEYVMVI